MQPKDLQLFGFALNGTVELARPEEFRLGCYAIDIAISTTVACFSAPDFLYVKPPLPTSLLLGSCP